MALSWRYPPEVPARVEPVAEAVPEAVPGLATETVRIRRGDTLADLLARAGVERGARVEMIAAIREAFDVRKLRAGSELTLGRSSEGTVEAIEYAIDPDHKLEVRRVEGRFRAVVVEIPGVVHEALVCGTMEGSLFESLQRAGERPELALQVAEIFAWDLDFYTDPRQGDEFCLLVEKKEYLNGQPATYRRILAAKYNNAGTVYDAYMFPDADGKPQYYSADGRSLRAAFLRSPMKFDARVSSHFSHRRFHPILKIYRPHLGTDYAAPAGTPVQAVGAGRVIFSGRSGAAGNLIRIQHANGFETQYLHLSRRFVQTGQRVHQGQRIGLVGATGLATGPHLDFRVRHHGRYVNFERLKPPRVARISAEQFPAFAADRNRYAAVLEAGFRPGAAVLASRSSVTSGASAP